jgi:oligogalacturonide lyase
VINSPSEHSKFRDAVTGAIVHQMTTHPSVNHPAYFLNSSFTPDGSEIFFTSYRTGSAQLFTAGFPGGDIRQMTGGKGIHPFSAVMHPVGERIFFVRDGGIWWVDRHSRAERLVVQFPDAQLGECALDRTGEWACAAVKQGPYHGIAAGRTNGAGWHIIPYSRTVIHPQFHPLEPEWIEFAGDPAPRMHRVKRDGSSMECLHLHTNDEFIVHETFLGQTGDLVFTVWPHSLRRMDWTTRKISTIADCNAWHISPNRAGTEILYDTNHPDRGILRINIATGEERPICLSESSNKGTQWAKSTYALTADFTKARCDQPSDALSWMETPEDTVYGPQWTHPHPAWSPGEKMVTFASDKSGHTQFYVAEVE